MKRIIITMRVESALHGKESRQRPCEQEKIVALSRGRASMSTLGGSHPSALLRCHRPSLAGRPIGSAASLLAAAVPHGILSGFDSAWKLRAIPGSEPPWLHIFPRRHRRAHCARGSTPCRCVDPRGRTRPVPHRVPGGFPRTACYSTQSPTFCPQHRFENAGYRTVCAPSTMAESSRRRSPRGCPALCGSASHATSCAASRV